MAEDEFDARVDEFRRRLRALKSKQPAGDQSPAAAASDELDELAEALEELQVAEEELRQQNEELLAARDALEAQQRRYRALFEFAPDAYLVTNLQGRILEANRAAMDLLGVTFGSLTDKVLQVFVPMQVRPAFRQRLNRIPEVDRIIDWEIQLRPRHAAGPVAVEATVATERDGGGRPQALRWQLRDVTARRRMEAERDAAQRALARRFAQLEVLHSIDQAILAARSPAEIAASTAARLRGLAQCARVTVIGYDHERGEAEYLAVDGSGPADLRAGARVSLEDVGLAGDGTPREVMSIPDVTLAAAAPPICAVLAGAGMRAFLSLPLHIDERTIGCLNLCDTQPAAFAGETIGAARQVADSLAVALQNARLLAQLRSSRSELQNLSRRLVTVQEEERSAIARELHDEVGQAIVSLMLGLRAVQNAGPDADTLNTRIEDVQRTADQVLGRLHQLAVNLRPASLDRLGLVPALQQYVLDFKEDTGLDAQFITVGLDGQPRLQPDVATALYRVVQEALANVVRHAHAEHVGVVLERREDWLVEIIEDDGAGFDVTAALAAGRLGLVGMRERVEALGGRLTIDSRPGGGTTVYTEVPYERADPDRR